MWISEMFESIQGEGPLMGHPMFFMRLSGCNLDCSYCDTKYHINGQKIHPSLIINQLEKSNINYVSWTGGEPSLQIEEIYDIIKATKQKHHVLETNGTKQQINTALFHSVIISPKSEAVADFWYKRGKNITIKVVTDSENLNTNLIKYADYLMPLTTLHPKRDIEIKKKVWTFCTNRNIKYSARAQQDVWGGERCK